MALKSCEIKIFGKVQGVGFRFYTHRKAIELNLKGYVQNKPDGSVYIEAEGEEENLEQFILWCNDGPAWARVLKVQLQETPFLGYKEFNIK